MIRVSRSLPCTELNRKPVHPMATVQTTSAQAPTFRTDPFGSRQPGHYNDLALQLALTSYAIYTILQRPAPAADCTTQAEVSRSCPSQASTPQPQHQAMLHPPHSTNT
jgi:hypothetical protein